MLKISYATDGIQVEFPFPYRLFADENLLVFLDDIQLVDGFVIQDEKSLTGARCIFSIAPEAGKKLTLIRQNIVKRATDFQEQNPLDLATLNFEFDYQVETMKDIFGQLNRCVHQSIFSEIDMNLTLPEPESGKALVWSENEDSLVNSEINISQSFDELKFYLDQMQSLYNQIQAYLSLSGDAGILGLVNNMIEIIRFHHPESFIDFELILNTPNDFFVFGSITDSADETIDYN